MQVQQVQRHRQELGTNYFNVFILIGCAVASCHWSLDIGHWCYMVHFTLFGVFLLARLLYLNKA